MEISTSFALRHLRAEDLGLETFAGEYVELRLYDRVPAGSAYIALGGPDSDRAADADAMDALSAHAQLAAHHLRGTKPADGEPDPRNRFDQALATLAELAVDQRELHGQRLARQALEAVIAADIAATVGRPGAAGSEVLRQAAEAHAAGLIFRARQRQRGEPAPDPEPPGES